LKPTLRAFAKTTGFSKETKLEELGKEAKLEELGKAGGLSLKSLEKLEG